MLAPGIKHCWLAEKQAEARRAGRRARNLHASQVRVVPELHRVGKALHSCHQDFLDLLPADEPQKGQLTPSGEQALCVLRKALECKSSALWSCSFVHKVAPWACL